MAQVEFSSVPSAAHSAAATNTTTTSDGSSGKKKLSPIMWLYIIGGAVVLLMVILKKSGGSSTDSGEVYVQDTGYPSNSVDVASALQNAQDMMQGQLEQELNQFKTDIGQTNLEFMQQATQQYQQQLDELKQQYQAIQSQLTGLTSHPNPTSTNQPATLITGSYKNYKEAQANETKLLKTYGASSAKLIPDGSGGYKVQATFSTKDRANKVGVDMQKKGYSHITHVQ